MIITIIVIFNPSFVGLFERREMNLRVQGALINEVYFGFLHLSTQCMATLVYGVLIIILHQIR